VERFGIGTGAFVDERDEWRGAVARAHAEGYPYLELTAVMEPLLVSLPEFVATDGATLAHFERVSLHAPIHVADAARSIETIAALPLDGDVVFHPDAWFNEPAVARLGPRVVFENMDVGKRFGRSVADLGRVFAAHPDAGLCLDVAHVWTVDPTMRLGHELIDAFGGRLRQLHVSGIEPDGVHRPTTAADLGRYRPLLDRCGHVPWILEAELVSAT
jgi:sugar phosphate isomerase/epimerase